MAEASSGKPEHAGTRSAEWWKVAAGVAVMVCAPLLVLLWAWFPRGEVAPEVPPNGQAFRVAALLPDPLNSGSAWTSGGYRGLMRVKEELGAEVAYVDDIRAESETLKQGERLAEEGYDAIIGNGSEFTEPFRELAARYPNTKFILVGAYAGNNENFGSVGFRDGGYLAGVVAALKSRSRKVAFVGGYLLPQFQATVEQGQLFLLGAKSVDPEIEAVVRPLNTWTDKTVAGAVAESLMDEGFDVIAVNADTAGDEIIRRAAARGVYVIGWGKDQHALAPQVVLTSVLEDNAALIYQAVSLVQRGRWEGKLYKFGIREGAQDLTPFRGLLSPEQEKYVAGVREGLLRDEIDLTLPRNN